MLGNENQLSSNCPENDQKDVKISELVTTALIDEIFVHFKLQNLKLRLKNSFF